MCSGYPLRRKLGKIEYQNIPGVFPPLLRRGAFVTFLPDSLGLPFPVLARPPPPPRAAELVDVRAMANGCAQ